MLDKLENVLIGLGTAFGITQLDTILGIIIMGLQIVLILYRLAMKIIDKVKRGKIDEIPQDIEDAKEDLEDLKDRKDD